MDWHFHCPSGASVEPDPTDSDGDGIPDNPGCPNSEILPGDDSPRICVGGCYYRTPLNDEQARSGDNSLHMGAHFDLTNAATGNTTHFRSLQSFVSAPINLALFPRRGDLELSFFHIVNLVDNNRASLADGSCADCADVQFQVDNDPDPAVDDWGFWAKLVPFQNVYDHRPHNADWEGYYCQFTPVDAGPDISAPRGIKETICFPGGAWSSCGSDVATTPADVGDCTGPGFLDPPDGVGVWVESKFNMKGLLGQRIRIRWIGASWQFDVDSRTGSYYEAGWQNSPADDGWWLDDIMITGGLESPLPPVVDRSGAAGDPTPDCPAGGFICDETMAETDHGTRPVLTAFDLDGALIDGVDVLARAGQPIRINAVDSQIPGGCTDGVVQYRFLRNGETVQDWSSKFYYADSPQRDQTYTVMIRCSSDHSCTSAAGVSLTLPVYGGDGADVAVLAAHDPGTGTTNLTWEARPQPSPMSGYDLFRGTVPPGLGSLNALYCNVPQAEPGSVIGRPDTSMPPVETAYYYVAGHRSLAPGATTILGRASDDSVRRAGFICP
jgi:hypothetical protein